jgi:hypothetical protein
MEPAAVKQSEKPKPAEEHVVRKAVARAPQQSSYQSLDQPIARGRQEVTLLRY